MRAITVTQPWASLIALGHKRVETRSWSAAYRGPIAIHASAAMPSWAVEYHHEVVKRLDVNLELWAYPRGQVVAVAEMIGCAPVEDLYPEITAVERLLGDYSAGRYGFILANVRAITPEPAKGKLGFWFWEPQREENRHFGSHPEANPHHPRAAGGVDRSGRHPVAATASGERPGL